MGQKANKQDMASTQRRTKNYDKKALVGLVFKIIAYC